MNVALSTIDFIAFFQEKLVGVFFRNFGIYFYLKSFGHFVDNLFARRFLVAQTTWGG